MKMTRRDFLKLSSAAAAACGVTLLPAQKADAASAIQTLLEEAYLYAFPLVLVDATRRPLPPAAPPSTSSSTLGSCWTLPAARSSAPMWTPSTRRRGWTSAPSLKSTSCRRPTAFSTCRYWTHGRTPPPCWKHPGPTPSPTRAGRARCPRASGASTFPPGRSGPSPASCSPGRTTCRTWRRFRAGCS